MFCDLARVVVVGRFRPPKRNEEDDDMDSGERSTIRRKWASRTALGAAQSALIALVLTTPVFGETIYWSRFNSLDLGLTQPHPGAAGQGLWYAELAVAPAFGEIQNQIRVSGRALHEHTSSANPEGQQTIDRRPVVNPSDLDATPFVMLEVAFYAHTSDLAATNSYRAGLQAFGGPEVHFPILGFDLVSGNGTPKGVAGVNLQLDQFNGLNNNEPVPLAVGQGLAWDSWHFVTLIVDQGADSYYSLTVDGQTQWLLGHQLPRSQVAGGAWERGQLIEQIQAAIIPAHNGASTNDDIYWDELYLSVGLFLDGFESGDTAAWSSTVP
jgi:hypothetical protein